MAFPVNGVLDNFDRADSTSTVGSNWSVISKVGANSGNQGISSNQLYNPFGGFSNYTAMYWNQAAFSNDMEAYMTIATKNSASSNDNAKVYARLTVRSIGDYDGYNISYFDSNGGFKISRADAGTETQLGATMSGGLASGDKIGISIIGSVISGYKYTAGSWSLLGTRTDTTYATGSRIGWYIPGNTQDGRFNDFGGGGFATITTATATQPKTIQTLQVGFVAGTPETVASNLKCSRLLLRTTQDCYIDFDQPIATTQSYLLSGSNMQDTEIAVPGGSITNLYAQGLTQAGTLYITVID